MLGMSEQQLNIWQEYIDEIGEDHFYYLPAEGSDFPIIYSRFFCGIDRSLIDPEGTKRSIAIAITRSKINSSLLKKPILSSKDAFELVSTVTPQFYDQEILMLLEECQTSMTLQEHWEFLIECWTEQELTTDGIRKENWEKIFRFHPSLPELIAVLPDEFTAYRAGELNGYSWTLDRSVAQKFQQRFALNFGDVPLQSRTFLKSEALFYTNRRNEQEVVIIPKNL